MTIMVVPSDLEAQVEAAGLIGVPFLAKGDTLAGWDCRGCARYALREFCGVDVPDYLDRYQAALLVGTSGRRERARLLAEGLAATWRAVPPQPGVVVLLHWLGGAGHVGFMLTPRLVLHADVRQGTAILDLDDPGSGYRVIGSFVPAFITQIQQETR